MIRYFIQPLRALRSLSADQRGLALIEFAISAPVLVILGLAGLEAANLALAHMRVSQIALLVADNAGRVRENISEADINEIMIGAEQSGLALGLRQNGRIFLSDLEPNGLTGTNEGQMIRWQRCWGDGPFTSSYGRAGDGTTNATLRDGMGPGTDATKKIKSMTGTAVMFVEVAYRYQPLVSDRWFGGQTIRYNSAFPVRERTNQTVQPVTGVTSNAVCT